MITFVLGSFAFELSGRLIFGMSSHLERTFRFRRWKNQFGVGAGFNFGIPFVLYMEAEVSIDNEFN